MGRRKLLSTILLEDDVVVNQIPWEMIRMFDAVLQAGESRRVQPVITGISGEDYSPGKVHAAGYAIDVRTAGVPDPGGFAGDIRRSLRAVSPHYKVLYGDAGHFDHIHIGFAWSFARRIL